MNKIFKYTLGGMIGVFEIPYLSEILSVQTQHGKPVMWASVPQDNINNPRKFYYKIVPTGGVVPVSPFMYLSTLQFDGGDYIYHIYIYYDVIGLPDLDLSSI